VLAGFALHRKSSLPLAAGLAAAAASLRLITKTKGEDLPLEEVFSEPPACEVPHACPESKFQLLDEGDFEEEDDAEGTDWVTSDAVMFEHVVPRGSPMPAPALAPALFTPQAQALPQEALALAASPQATSFPLLDDDGIPVSSLPALPHSLSPEFVEAADEFGFPLGPMIWEPDDPHQHCLESEGDTAWFSSGDVIRPPAPPVWTAPVSLAPPTAPQTLVAPAVHAPAYGAGTPVTPESMTSILESLRAEAAARGEATATELAVPMPVPAATIANGSTPQEALSFADWMLSTQSVDTAALPPAGIAPRVSAKTTLPSPRQHGRAPRLEAEDRRTSHLRGPALSEGTKRPLTPPSPKDKSVHPSSPPSPALVYHRSVAPMAPVQLEEPPSTRRPLTMVLVALILTVVLIAMALWGDGQISGKAKTPPWTQDPLPAREQVTTAKAPTL
jgi:hypothetical protein